MHRERASNSLPVGIPSIAITNNAILDGNTTTTTTALSARTSTTPTKKERNDGTQSARGVRFEETDETKPKTETFSMMRRLRVASLSFGKASNDKSISKEIESPISKLPLLPQIAVFNFLPALDLCRASMVCKEWKKLIESSDFMWEKHIDRDFGNKDDLNQTSPTIVVIKNSPKNLSAMKRYALLHSSQKMYLAHNIDMLSISRQHANLFQFDGPNNIRAKQTYSIMCLGDVGQGKTTLSSMFIFGRAPTRYDPTIEDRHTRIVQLEDGIQVKVEVIDVGGEPKLFAKMADKWVFSADGFIVVYNRHDEKAAHRLRTWLTMIETMTQVTSMPILVVAQGTSEVLNDTNKNSSTTTTPTSSSTSSSTTENITEYSYETLRTCSIGRTIAAQAKKTWIPLDLSDKNAIDFAFNTVIKETILFSIRRQRK
eukprot:c16671_g1_i1.p1 GENE.c16671_g1_i1~~c16671_g1_i1.p1  ORF type:complete len:428 (-),score=157.52 c16671_g1_i1:94-1377(-)